MNKSKLIEAMAEEAGLTKADAGRALDAFVKTVTKELKGKGKVSLIGFGTFKTSERAARVGRNPMTNEKVNIAARTAVSFKPGASLKEEVNS